MLVLADKVSRKYGIKQYLEEGKDGKRNEYDERVPLSGDLNILNSTIKLGGLKNNKENYRNYVLSFQEDDISNDDLTRICTSFINLLSVGYSKYEYVAYAEAHRPRIKADDKGNKRYLHVHISIARYSPELGRQLDLGHNGSYVKTGGRMREFNLWKDWIENIYGLKKTVNNSLGSSNKNISFETGKIKDKNDSSKYNINNFRIELLKEIEKNISLFKNYNHLKEQLLNLQMIDSMKQSTSKARVPYLTLVLNSGQKVRLKGELFSHENFEEEKQKLLNPKEIDNTYKEANERKDISMPLELKNLLAMRKDKITKDLKSVREKAEKRIQKEDDELIPLSIEEYKSWKRKLEYKTSTNKVKEPEFIHSNPLSYHVNFIEEENQKKIESSEVEIRIIKQILDPKLLLLMLEKSHNLNINLYQCLKNKKGEHRIRAGKRNLNVADFLTKEINMNWEQAFLYLRDAFVLQTKERDQRRELEEKEENKRRVKNVDSYRYNRISYQNKIFIDIYKEKTDFDLSDFYIKKYPDKVVLTSKKLDIEIVDKGDVIESINTPHSNIKDRVRLHLDIAEAKGWNLNTMETTGSQEFIDETARQIELRYWYSINHVEQNDDVDKQKGSRSRNR